jgi:hypothetical protein
MTTKTGTMATERPERYAKQLFSHWARRGEQTDEGGASTFRFTESGNAVTLRPQEGLLHVQIDVPEGNDADRFAQVVADHLQRFGQKDELEVAWED